MATATPARANLVHVQLHVEDKGFMFETKMRFLIKLLPFLSNITGIQELTLSFK